MWQLGWLLTSRPKPPCICTWNFQNSRFLLCPSGQAPQSTVLVLHAALRRSQDVWPEQRALLVVFCSWETHSSPWKTATGNKSNSSVALISLQPSAAAICWAFLSSGPTWPLTPWAYRALALCCQVPCLASHAYYRQQLAGECHFSSLL